MTDIVLKTTNVAKSFSGVHVLHGVNLELRRGEVLGLVGENGAGKSTLMNMVGGVLPVDSGSMELAGDPIRTICGACAIGGRLFLG